MNYLQKLEDHSYGLYYYITFTINSIGISSIGGIISKNLPNIFYEIFLHNFRKYKRMHLCKL